MDEKSDSQLPPWPNAEYARRMNPNYETNQLLGRILLELRAIKHVLKREVEMTQALTDIDAALLAEITEEKAPLVAAAAALAAFPDRLAAALETATDDSAAVAAVKDAIVQMRANIAPLAAAVVANTPAAAPPTVPDPASPPPAADAPST